MFELIQITDKSYYIENPARVGLYRLDRNSVCLIDSGHDRAAGKRILRVLTENGWLLNSIYLTHCHADHARGAAYLTETTGCRLYAPETEREIAMYPILQSAVLYGGCPPEELRQKSLMGEPVNAGKVTPDTVPEGFSIIPLPGHFFNMAGYRTPDGVAYIGDSVLSAEALSRIQIGFVYDVQAQLGSLSRLRKLSAVKFVPSHAAPVDDITELSRLNEDKIYEIADLLWDFCSEPRTAEQIVQYLFGEFSLRYDFELYSRVSCTARSYLTWLASGGKLKREFRDNMLYWVRSQGGIL